MNLQSDWKPHYSRRPAGHVRRWYWRAAKVLLLMISVAGVAGFVWFLSLMRSIEDKPSHNADGIVVLTGGSSRVADAMELLATGYGKRLLISGVYPSNGANDIVRLLPDHQRLLACCIDLDHSAVNTRSNATETRRWASDRGFRSLIVVTSNYHMPRAILELSYAMPDMKLIPFAVIGDKWRDEPWWTSGAALRLLLSEYVKYIFAEIRVMLGSVGQGARLTSGVPALHATRKPATASDN